MLMELEKTKLTTTQTSSLNPVLVQANWLEGISREKEISNQIVLCV